MRTFVAAICGIPEAKVRVIAPDVGGGFGSKLNVYAEEFAIAQASRLTGRPVKWIETRSESMVATIHGRDQLQTATIAADADGRVQAHPACTCCRTAARTCSCSRRRSRT